MSHIYRHGQPERHHYSARVEGRSVIVVDNNTGEPAEGITFAGTSDSRTVYCFAPEGFIGGWQCLKRSIKVPPWITLADRINEGILYHDLDDLPGGGKRARRES